MPDPNPSPETAPLPLPPDPDNMNDKRAAAAERALLSFSADFGELVEGEDFTSQNLADLLANLAHLCDRKGLNFGESLDKARGYYRAETDNEGTQFANIYESTGLALTERLGGNFAVVCTDAP